MKELNRYDFANDKALVTHLLDAEDQQRIGLPECDVIGLERVDNNRTRFEAMRPDEALILARLLIDAVWQVTEGYTITGSDDNLPRPLPLKDKPAAATLVRDLEEDSESSTKTVMGFPVVTDSTVPKDEIHVRQNGKTEAVLKMSDSGECREIWRSLYTRGADGRPYPNDQ